MPRRVTLTGPDCTCGHPASWHTYTPDYAGADLGDYMCIDSCDCPAYDGPST